ncbi:hypothetical protein [uncultured Clostridium sp.]|uniref:hypothetical protein n=1 Tax=uncultured Clostridium sp. TaxID=59620 RepID=UPI00261098FF|nr:hypothetical protein [uncultured Clostridium sp.]
MDNHMLKQNVSSGDLNNEYYNRIHSIIDNINDVIFLTEDKGWINGNGEKVNCGTWNNESRIATLDNSINQQGKLFIIAVSNVTIDGTGTTIGNNDIAVSILSQRDIALKNFIVEGCELGVYIEFCQGISVQYISFKENKQSISINRSTEVKIKNNLMESEKNSSLGIYVLDSGKILVQDNLIYIKVNIHDEGEESSYCGIITENSTAIFILNNEIDISKGYSEVKNLESYCVNSYCISCYSSYDTLIKSNNLYIKNNNLNFYDCNVLELNFSPIYLDSNNAKIDIEENNIVVGFNKFDVQCNIGGIGFYGIVYSNKNNANSIKNNYISIESNTYDLNSDENPAKYICFMGILLDSYNNYNEIKENQIYLQGNTTSFKQDSNRAVNLLCGTYLNDKNNTNNIIDNDFIIKENNIDERESIITTFSLIYLYYDNICNTIKGNNLNEGQGNKIKLINKNDITEILENNIITNLSNEVLLSELETIKETNMVVINGNNIIN